MGPDQTLTATQSESTSLPPTLKTSCGTDAVAANGAALIAGGAACGTSEAIEFVIASFPAPTLFSAVRRFTICKISACKMICEA